MGCVASVYSIGRNKNKKNIPEISIFVPPFSLPVQCDVQGALRGLVPNDLANRLSSIRSEIVLVTEDFGGSAITKLQRVLEEYLPLLIGLIKKEYSLQELVQFKWMNLEDGRQEICVANSWFEVFCVVHLMAMLTMMEANLKLIPEDHSGSGGRVVTADCMREAVDLLLKAAGYLEFCVRDVLVHIPPDIKSQLATNFHEGILEAISHQALGQGTEMQLGFAVQSQNATLSVKRRLACEQLSYFCQANYCLSKCGNNHGYGKKHVLFIKWKCLEAKAAAYYYHGLILDKQTEPSSRISAVCCFLAAEELLAESKKACLSFCLVDPVTRVPPSFGAMKHLNKKIPETALKKSQMYGYLLEQEKGLHILPDLPEFQLSLKPDDYEFPEIDSSWDSEKWEFPLREHLEDYYEDEA